MPKGVEDLLKDVLFFKLMEEIIPLDMERAREYAEKQDKLIKSMGDPAFFDLKYYGALSNALTELQQSAIVKNMSHELSDKALRITVYIFLKQHFLLNKKNIEVGIREHPDKITQEDLDKADKYAQMLYDGLENCHDEILSKEFK